jgi:hypothetical protein
MGVVPEALRPKPGHLTPSQQRVYEVNACWSLPYGMCGSQKEST